MPTTAKFSSIPDSANFLLIITKSWHMITNSGDITDMVALSRTHTIYRQTSTMTRLHKKYQQRNSPAICSVAFLLIIAPIWLRAIHSYVPSSLRRGCFFAITRLIKSVPLGKTTLLPSFTTWLSFSHVYVIFSALTSASTATLPTAVQFSHKALLRTAITSSGCVINSSPVSNVPIPETQQRHQLWLCMYFVFKLLTHSEKRITEFVSVWNRSIPPTG